MREITFIIEEDPADGGYTARAHWPQGNRSIHTQGEDSDELVRNIRDALDVTFAEGEERPQVVHLHYVRDETLVLAPTKGDARYSLRGKPYHFDDPHAPVAVENWGATLVPTDQKGA